MDTYSFRRHRHDLAEIGRMYLVVVAFFVVGLLVWKVGQLTGSPWEGRATEAVRPSPHYDR
jgi:hypothetical protein